MKFASKEAEVYHMWARRRLGVRDHDNAPDVDEAIKEELEYWSLSGGEVSFERIRAKLKLPTNP